MGETSRISYNQPLLPQEPIQKLSHQRYTLKNPDYCKIISNYVSNRGDGRFRSTSFILDLLRWSLFFQAPLSLGKHTVEILTNAEVLAKHAKQFSIIFKTVFSFQKRRETAKEEKSAFSPRNIKNICELINDGAKDLSLLQSVGVGLGFLLAPAMIVSQITGIATNTIDLIGQCMVYSHYSNKEKTIELSERSIELIKSGEISIKDLCANHSDIKELQNALEERRVATVKIVKRITSLIPLVFGALVIFSKAFALSFGVALLLSTITTITSMFASIYREAMTKTLEIEVLPSI